MDLDVSALRRNNFFSEFSDSEIKKILKQGNINRFNEGTTVFLQGDQGDAMYILLTGQVQILLTGNEMDEVLATLRPGDVFGEGSFANDSPRSAKATSTRDTYLYVITSDHLGTMIEKESKVAAKMLYKLLRIVIDRLNVTNKRLSASG